MTDKIQRPRLGQRVICSALVVKGREKRVLNEASARNNWENLYAQKMSFEEYVQKKGILFTTFERVETQEFEGIYVGFRVVHNGYRDIEVEYGDYGGAELSRSVTFKRQSSRVIWLVLTDERSNPLRVFPEDCHVVKELL
jgi:hypothetical protein